MMTRITKYIAGLLLGTLGVSCIGLHLGMLFSQNMSLDSGSAMSAVHSQEMMSKEGHGCCGVMQPDETGATEEVALSHHNSIRFVLPGGSYVMLVQYILLYSLVTIVFSTLVIRIFLYYRRWGELWQYFALYTTRLFAAGILHAKSW